MRTEEGQIRHTSFKTTTDDRGLEISEGVVQHSPRFPWPVQSSDPNLEA